MSAYAVSARGLAGRKVPQGVLATMDELLFSGSEQGVWYDPSDLSTLFQDSAGTVPVTAVEQPVGRMLDKSGRGNHATQSTTTKRPVYSRRVNAQIYSEDFTNAAFRKLSVTVTANQAVAPDGTLTANLVEGLNSGESRIDSYPTYYGSGRNEQRTISVYVKKGTASTVRLDLIGFSYATLNLDTGVVSGVVDATASAEALSDGWFRFSLSFMKTNEYHWAKLIIDGGVATAGSIYVWGWQEEHGLVATRYQRVNTATDYDADPAKFPAYLSIDGVDDAMATIGNVNLGSAQQLAVVSGYCITKGTGTSLLAELSSTSVTGGAFSLFVRQGDGTCGWSIAAPQLLPVSAVRPLAEATVNAVCFDRGGASTEAVFKVLRLNRENITPAFTFSSQTPTFAEAPLYLFARNNGTAHLMGGRFYGLIVRGAQTSLSQIEATELYMKQKMRLP